MKNCLQNYRLLGQTIDVVNKLFGFQLLLIIFHSGLHVVNSLNFVNLYKKSEFGKFNSDHVLMSSVVLILLLLYNTFSVIIVMDSTVEEARKFHDLCHQLADHYSVNSEEMKIIGNALSYSKQFFREFSAGGYFTINKSVIISLLGNVATYIIISTQFNMSGV
ncbi:hypothetical protein Zmor_019950 [Zophobas morio]|uniref:Gustatory receptor n=1 Tax=Zophobas morio TaxID=2755281 RepID=A0AA38I4J2_9CUCU|nr:hypothetical protein Zmor_019950 [Zophobas morio]